MRQICSTSRLRMAVWPVSMRQILASDHSRRSAAARTVRRWWLRSSRRCRPSWRRGTVEPVVISDITHLPSETRVADPRFESTSTHALKCIHKDHEIATNYLFEVLHVENS